jgi:site-specific recombinase XerC
MDADAGLVERYLEYARVEKRLAARTVELYALDLQRLSTLAIQAQVPLLEVRNAHIRRWVAQMHSAGRSGRGIALILSGWRGFYTWLGRDGLVASNPVQDVRSPKAPKPLPKALGVDDAVQFADFQSDDDPWLEARDTAMVELLYGSGLLGRPAGSAGPCAGQGFQTQNRAGGQHRAPGAGALAGIAWADGHLAGGTRACSTRRRGSGPVHGA